MALINCPECNKEISDKAYSCPNCGYPISKFSESEIKTVNSMEEIPAIPAHNGPYEKPKKHKKHTFVKVILSFVIIVSLLGIAFVPLYFVDPFDWFGNPNYEEIIVTCVRDDLRKNLKDRTSLNLVDNPRVLFYGGYSISNNEIAFINDSGYGVYAFIEIPYSATNSYGARVENSAFYHIQLFDEGYSYQYIGDMRDFEDYDIDNWNNYSDIFHQFMLCNLDLHGYTLYPDEEKVFDGEKIAKKADCGYIE